MQEREISRKLGQVTPVVEAASDAPRLGSGAGSDTRRLLRMALELRLLGRDDMREFLRLIGMNIHDEVTERFDSPLLKGAVSLDAVRTSTLELRYATAETVPEEAAEDLIEDVDRALNGIWPTLWQASTRKSVSRSRHAAPTGIRAPTRFRVVSAAAGA